MTLKEFDDFLFFVRQEVARGISSGLYVQKSVRSVLFNPEFRFEFKDGLLTEFPSSTSIGTKLIWDNQAQHYLQNHIEFSYGDFFSEHKYIAERICNAVLAKDEIQINYLRNIIFRKENKEPLNAIAQTFYNGIGLDPANFTFSASGMIFELSQMSYEDFIQEAEAGFSHNRYEISGFHCKITMPTESNDPYFQRKLQNELDTFELIISLFGNSVPRRQRINFYTEYELGTLSSLHSPKVESFAFYSLSNKHLEIIAHNYENMRSALNASAFLEGVTSPFQVAFERYSDAILYKKAQKKVAAAVMGLEALFTRQGPELSYSLRMRANIFIKLLGKADIREAVKLAYDIRCEYAHGKVENQNIRKKILAISSNEHAFADQIIEILRHSVLGSLMLGCGHNSKEIERFQNDLDDILSLDSEALNKLTSREDLSNLKNLII